MATKSAPPLGFIHLMKYHAMFSVCSYFPPLERCKTLCHFNQLQGAKYKNVMSRIYTAKMTPLYIIQLQAIQLRSHIRAKECIAWY